MLDTPDRVLDTPGRVLDTPGRVLDTPTWPAHTTRPAQTHSSTSACLVVAVTVSRDRATCAAIPAACRVRSNCILLQMKGAGIQRPEVHIRGLARTIWSRATVPLALTSRWAAFGFWGWILGFGARRAGHVASNPGNRCEGYGSCFRVSGSGRERER